MLQFHETTEAEKEIISAWHYAGEYAIYDLPPYAEAKARGQGLANPKNHFLSFYDRQILVGFLNLVEEPEQVFVGIGVAPDLCSRGYGRQMLTLAAREAAERWPGLPLYLEVRSWNRRAVRCYEAAGFRVDGPAFIQTTGIGEGAFYRMVLPVSKAPKEPI